MYFLKQLLLVGLGGFIGSALRFAIGGWVQQLAAFSTFPYGTLVVNLLGCLLIGFLGGLVEYRGLFESGQRLFLIIGLLGGFTTFSTFAFETLMLAQDAAVIRAAVNIVAQVVIGITAAMIGYVGARMI